MNNTELEEKLFSDHRIRDIVGGICTSDAIHIHVISALYYTLLTVTLVTCQENIGS